MIYTDEKNLLGALKLDPSLFNQLGDNLTAQFFVGQNRTVFEAMTELREDGREITEANILEIVSAKGIDYAFLSSLSEGIPRGNTVENICESIRRISIKRLAPKLLAEAQRIAKDSGNDGEPDFTSAQEIIEQAKALSENNNTTSTPTTLVLSEVEARAVPWLAKDYFPIGEGILWSGDPGSAKTFLALDLAARITTGRPWIDGARMGEPANVYYLNYEDNPHYTLRPRFDSLGGDPKRFFLHNPEHPAHLDLNSEAGRKRMERDIAQIGNVRLAVADPILDFSGGVNPSKVEDVRALLTPLISMAARMGFAFLLIGHLNKAQTMSAIYRAGGTTQGWLGKCRAAFLIFRDEDDKKLRHFVALKANLAENDPRQIEFRPIRGTIEARVSEIEVDVQDHLNPQAGRRPREKGKAIAWLEQQFATRQEIPATEIEDAALEQGLSTATLNRAKADGGFTSKKRIQPNGTPLWVWLKP